MFFIRLENFLIYIEHGKNSAQPTEINSEIIFSVKLWLIRRLMKKVLIWNYISTDIHCLNKYAQN
jgi:hypothetical protein